MISYLGSLVQFSPVAGRAGRYRQMSLCVGSTGRVPATLGLPHTGVSVLSPSTLLRLPAALYGAGPALSAVPVFGSSTKAQIRLCLRVVSSPARAAQAARGLHAFSRVRHAFSLRGERPGQPEVCAASPRVRPRQPEAWCPLHVRATPFPSAASGPGSQRFGALSPGAPFPSAAPVRAAGRVSGSLQTGTRPVCRVGGGGFSGAEFAPCPSRCLLPPAGMGRLFSGVSQSLCFANRRRCIPAG